SAPRCPWGSRRTRRPRRGARAARPQNESAWATSRGAGLDWSPLLLSSCAACRARLDSPDPFGYRTLRSRCCARDPITPEEAIMRRLGTCAGGLVAVLALSGCANFHDREWGFCAVGGGIIGGAVGGVTAGAAINNTDNPSDGERAGAIVGSTIGGAALGALLGHVVCDPQKEAAP